MATAFADSGSRHLYAARIEDLEPVDFMVVECHSCNNVGLLSARFLLSLGYAPPSARNRGKADWLNSICPTSQTIRKSSSPPGTDAG